MKKRLSKYNNLIIFYFSGTGNAKNAAKWIGNVGEGMGIPSRIVNIDNIESVDTADISEKTLLGFCTPTHGFNVPPIVLKFILKFPALKNVDAFILNTRAGVKLHKLFLPGLSGLAQILPALILKLKGYRVVGMQPLDLPSNWLLIHPGLRKKVVDSMYARCNRIVDKFATKMFEGKRVYIALLSLPIDLALTWIAFLYYIIGRFFLAKTLVASDACNACEECVIQCPVHAIKMVNDRPFWTYRCESCMRCVNHCKQRAIQTAHAFSTGIIVLMYMVILPLLIALLKLIGAWEVIKQSFILRNVWDLVYSFIFLVIMFMAYGILHYLMRFRWVNKFITYTSLSKYAFWRRYKAPKTKFRDAGKVKDVPV